MKKNSTTQIEGGNLGGKWRFRRHGMIVDDIPSAVNRRMGFLYFEKKIPPEGPWKRLWR